MDSGDYRRSPLPPSWSPVRESTPTAARMGIAGGVAVGRSVSVFNYPRTAGPDEAMHSLEDSAVQPTNPLGQFGEAKNRMSEHLEAMQKEVAAMYDFLRRILDTRLDLVRVEDAERAKDFARKISAIKEIIARNQMKVAFFGRTSNGKSTVINALLSQRVLPTGIGHTTDCFLQVEGTNEEKPFLLSDGPDAKSQPIENVRNFAHALELSRHRPESESEQPASLGSNSLVRVFIPRTRCPLLRNEVVLVDSPGIDVDMQLDSWIDAHCLDADVFILVGNAESTLLQIEKNFFHKVSQKLSKPNVFILLNRWDASTEEVDVEDVKKQHLERCTSFLVNELKICNTNMIQKRVFFVSARNTLRHRLRLSGQAITPTGSSLQDLSLSESLGDVGAQLFDFDEFEHEFQRTLSTTAIRTKFASHADQTREIAVALRQLLEQTTDTILDRKEKCIRVVTDTKQRRDDLQLKLERCNAIVERDVQSAIELIERKVSQALDIEIKKLAQLVEEFSAPFVPERIPLLQYKSQLNEHVEQLLGQRLQQLCSMDIHRIVTKTEMAFLDRFSNLLQSEESQNAMKIAIQPSNFEVTFALDCKRLCSDFREDVEFHFSLGVTALMNRFFGKRVQEGRSRSRPPTPTGMLSPPFRTGQRSSGNGGGEPLTGSLTAQLAKAAVGSRNGEVISVLLRSSPAILSKRLLGAVLIAGIVSRAVGWRVLLLGAGAYGSLYMYERLSWTTRAKERALKRQYVAFASEKLRYIVHVTAEACAGQARQELISAHRRLRREAERCERVLTDQERDARHEIELLEQLSGEAKYHRNKASFLEQSISEFVQKFIGTFAM